LKFIDILNASDTFEKRVLEGYDEMAFEEDGWLTTVRACAVAVFGLF
jgi:hypothetical protein